MITMSSLFSLCMNILRPYRDLRGAPGHEVVGRFLVTSRTGRHEGAVVVLDSEVRGAGERSSGPITRH